MPYLNILYEEKLHDRLFNKLKRTFSSSVNDVNVYEIIPDEYIKIEWSSSQDPIELATELTNEFPDIIIETESNSGIDLFSRFFNGNQLW